MYLHRKTESLGENMLNLNASTTRLDAVEEPSDADLLALEPEVAEAESVEWESLLPAPITAKESDDFWSDDAPLDDRWSGDGIPSWSVWA